MRAVNLAGERFGRLTVLSRAASVRDADGASRSRWCCICDCGTEIIVRTQDLRRGKTQSCGCLKHDMVCAPEHISRLAAIVRTPEARERSAANGRRLLTKHGLCDSPTYNSWRAMIARCTNPRHSSFMYYGARGITICERWRESFENFLADMGERPAGMTLDRYPDNDGNYEPGNCRWATASEQTHNRRSSARPAP